MLEGDADLRIQDRRQIGEDAVGGLPIQIEPDGNTGTGRKSLRVVEVELPGIGLQGRHTVELQVRQGKRLVFLAAVGIDRGIVGGNRGAGAEGGLHQTRGARTRAARASCRAACARPRGSRAQTSHAAAGSALHHAGVHSPEISARLGAQNVGVGNGDVVAGDRQIQIVLEREIDRIFQRQIELSVTNQLVETGRIRQLRLGNRVRGISPHRDSATSAFPSETAAWFGRRRDLRWARCKALRS